MWAGDDQRGDASDGDDPATGARCLVRQAGEEGAPPRVTDGLGQMVIPHQVGGLHVLVIEGVMSIYQRQRGLMVDAVLSSPAGDKPLPKVRGMWAFLLSDSHPGRRAGHRHPTWDLGPSNETSHQWRRGAHGNLTLGDSRAPAGSCGRLGRAGWRNQESAGLSRRSLPLHAG